MIRKATHQQLRYEEGLNWLAQEISDARLECPTYWNTILAPTEKYHNVSREWKSLA